MKIDPTMMEAFRAGEAAGAAGAGHRDNPHYYTSCMSDAWEIGRRLTVTARMGEIAQIVGLSSRGLTCKGVDGSQFKWRVSYIPSTQGHEIWRARA